MQDVPLIAAGSLAVIGAAVHGGAGQVLVLRRLPATALPSTNFGGPQMTRAMIQAAWHMTTVAFVAVGVGLILSGSVLEGDAARGISRLAAAAATGFALMAIAFGGAYKNFPRSVLDHPGPIVLTLTAALAWWGAL